MQSKNFHAKVWKVSLENTTTWKITSSTSSVGSNQDEAEIQYDQCSTQEWCNCEECEKMPTS